MRTIQLDLFNPISEDDGGGIIYCSLEHKKPIRAKYRIHFKNGRNREVCGRCVKRFQPGGDSFRIVDRIEKL